MNWSAPSNAGPAITDYDVQYRAGTSGGWTDAGHAGTAVTATLAGLSENTSYQVQVRATNDEGTGSWSDSGSTSSPGNNAPVFPGSSTERRVEENLGAATDPGGRPVGGAVAATDDDPDDTLAYSLEGTDAGSFSIDRGSGQIRTLSGLAYDYEERPRYSVTVKADDRNGGTAAIAVTIQIDNLSEPPLAPEVRSVTGVAGGSDSLAVSWERPDNTGRPAISGYQLRYRTGSGAWSDPLSFAASATSATVSGLVTGTEYQVQARASNVDGYGAWSFPRSGHPGTVPLRAVIESAPRPPDRHSGYGDTFQVRYRFSDPISISSEGSFRFAVDAQAGTVTAARSLAGDSWEIDVEPFWDDAVRLTLPASDSCANSDAICSAAGQPLEQPLQLDVAGPDTPLVTVRVQEPFRAVEGARTARFELRREGPAAEELEVYLEVEPVGVRLGRPVPAMATFAAGDATASIEVTAVDDNAGGNASVSVRVPPDAAVPLQYMPLRGAGEVATARVRSSPAPVVTVQEPVVRRRSRPLQLALWTDRPGYRAGDTVRLYLTLDPHDDRGRYLARAYLEPAAGDGPRRYLAALPGPGSLREEPADLRGRPLASAPTRSLPRAEKTLAWEGPAPETGLWQFVLVLEPGPDGEFGDEPAERPRTRRAWAKFTVAAGSQLLNRRGFDREIREDLTLRADTLYYLGHQLFVHDGATLSIEPGTVVLAWGRNTAIVVERGGKIVAEGTREAPVVLTCSQPTGRRQPGCWGGLRLLGKAPVTRLEGLAHGVLPAERPAYGGSSPDDSSGTLRHVRVEFAGAGAEPGTFAPALGLYGAGAGTVLEHVQARSSLGDGIAFSGGTAACDFCVASGSGEAGLAWERGWQGAARHLFVFHGPEGYDGLRGGNDAEGHDLQPRSAPALASVTLIHASPYGPRARQATGLRLETGSAVTASDLLVTRFGGGAIAASSRSALLFAEGESGVSSALLHRNGHRPRQGQLRGNIAAGVDLTDRDPKLRDTRLFANPDPRPKADSPALKQDGAAQPAYIGAFGKDLNWLEEWTVFGPEQDYGPHEADGAQQ